MRSLGFNVAIGIIGALSSPVEKQLRVFMESNPQA
jgi:hypothetical protein